MKNPYSQLGISDNVYEHSAGILNSLKERFEQIDAVSEYNQCKVLKAFQKNKVSAEHLNGSTGYGYQDIGRDTLERVYADIFHTEDALVRPQIVCGTHALTIAMSAVLRPGDEMLSPVGKPYDTMESIIGIRKTEEENGSFNEFGISYSQVDLLPDGSFDFGQIQNAVKDHTKLVTIQRSCGYDSRPTLSVEKIGELISFVKKIKPDLICMVDNCYGEFVDIIEPADVGADLCVGSLIKNPGGGLAPTGGDIAGKKKYVEMAGYRLVSPGLGKEAGATLQINPLFYQGLFLAPAVVAAALKSAVFAAGLYESIGFSARPDRYEPRHDIIQTVELESKEAVIAFCRGIQAAAPIDSYAAPEPCAMPGYQDEVIMAAGAFVQGASIELSADAPIREPYRVFFQGGLTWPHGKFGIMMSLQKLYDENLVVF